MRVRLCLAVGLLLAGVAHWGFAAEAVDTRGESHALLVGCTRYPHLMRFRWLEGPANDVALLRQLLVERFAFPEKNIRVLAEDVGGDESRPVRANIVCEFRRLARVVGPDDYVVILLAGHGTSQPDDDPQNPLDPEPDGLDEVFCPADVRKLETGGGSRIPGGICDDEIRGHLREIRAKGASVWVIVDACHSGTLIRGNGQEVARGIPADELLPKRVLDEARRAAGVREARRGPVRGAGSFEMPDEQGGLVATYAAQPDETTPEKPLPDDDPQGVRRGLFTYSLVKVLTEARAPLSYGELVERIHRQYVKWGRIGPTPLVEGPDRDRRVLGRTEWPGRRRILIRPAGKNRFKITAGTIHGLTEGSILAVHPPPGEEPAERPLGHVRLSRVGSVAAEAEPWAFGEVPSRNDLPDGGHCRVVKIDYGDLRLKVAIDHAGPNPKRSASLAAAEKLKQQLGSLAEKDGSLVELCDDADGADGADWLVRFTGSDVFLVPAEGWAGRPEDHRDRRFGPVPIDRQTIAWLEDRLGRIARARNLLRIATQTQDEPLAASHGTRHETLDIHLDMLRREDGNRPQWVPVQWGPAGIRLGEGDEVKFRVENRGRRPVDITLLFIDSDYGIESIFPTARTRADNRLRPRETYQTKAFGVTGTTIGLEHVVLIAVVGEGVTVDFCWLAQPTIRRAGQEMNTRSTAADNLDSPLGLLLQQAMFAAGNTRGLQAEEARNCSLAVVSWYTEKKR